MVADGKKLTPQEEAKRRRHPLDMWDDLAQHAAENRFPKGNDVLAFKYHGLFYVAPAQDSYMCRLRMPGGILTSHQFRGIDLPIVRQDTSFTQNHLCAMVQFDVNRC